MKRLIILAWLLVGCPVPQPVPVPPGPQPVGVDAARDNFTGKIFDCRASVVAVERESAAGDVNYCLAGSSSAAVNACVALKLGQYNSATVACLIRDLGADANAAFLMDKTDQGAQVRADGARAWINEHVVGYR